MRRLMLAFLALAGCTTIAGEPRADGTAIAGSWRAPNSGQTVSISTFSTFVVQRGCAATGGVLKPLGGGRYRIGRYETGFASEGCGPWRNGPEAAPFDGSHVTLLRQGDRLIAGNESRRVVYRRIGPPIV